MEADRKQQIMKFLENNKEVLLIALVFFIINISLVNTIYSADEGTHVLLSLFYKDLMTFVPSHLSFSEIYNYAINYLVHYPKLSVYYPPLFHIAGALLFFINSGYFTLTALSLTFATLAIVFLYFLTLTFTKSKKIAIIASILLTVSPIVFVYSIQALTETVLLFAAICVLYLWYNYIENSKGNVYLLTLLSIILVFAKQHMILIFLVLFAYTLIYKKAKKIIIPFVIIGTVFGIYLFGLYKLGVLQSMFTSSLVAATEKDPTFTTLAGWLFYPKTLIFNYITIPFALLGFVEMYKWFKSKKEWQILLLMLFFITLIFFIFVPNKDPRYILPAIIPLVIATASLMSRYLKNNYYLLAIAIYGIFVLFATVNMAPQASYGFLSVLEKPGNIGIISESSSMYSSNMMALYALNHPMDRVFYRPCAFFDNKTLLEDVRYAIVVVPFDKAYQDQYNESINYAQNNDLFQKVYEHSENGISTYVYENQNYVISDTKCNFVCIKQESVCYQ
jgi:4-amino-4-deoxy-L-arabinose transferase-like glycosyltransferase